MATAVASLGATIHRARVAVLALAAPSWGCFPMCCTTPARWRARHFSAGSAGARISALLPALLCVAMVALMMSGMHGERDRSGDG